MGRSFQEVAVIITLFSFFIAGPGLTHPVRRHYEARMEITKKQEESIKATGIQFSHIVSFYGIRCLWGEQTNTLLPIGKIREFLFGIVMRIHLSIAEISMAMLPGFNPCFKLHVLGEIVYRDEEADQ